MRSNVPLLLAGLLFANPVSADSAKLKKLHAITVEKKLPSSLVKQTKKGKNTLLLDACLGSFVSAGDHEYVIGAYNPKTGKMTVRAHLTKDFVPTATVEILSFSLPADAAVLFGMECLSVMGIKRLQKTIDHGELEGKAKSINGLDAVCFPVSYVETKCFQYDMKKKRFVSIGGTSS